MTKQKWIFLIVVGIVTLMAVTAVLTYHFTMGAARNGEIYIRGDEYDKLMKYFELSDVETMIADSYFQTNDKNLVEGALKGFMEALDDGYSRFYPEEDFQYFDDKSGGSYIGQGMMLELDEQTGYMEVTRVFPDTPADEANIQPGDKICSIDGRDTREIDVDNAVSRLRGLDGTKAKLVIQNAEGKEISVEFVRKSSDIQVAFSDMLTEEIGYIDIVEFSGTSVSDLKNAIETLETEGAKGMILDLRGCPGGNISQAIEAADLFLEEGTICVTVGKEDEKNTWTADSSALWKTKPIVIIVDEETSGVAEVFCAALRDNERATMVGETTKGMGVALSFLEIPSTGDGIKLITAQYQTPKGDAIYQKGIAPDEAVEAAQLKEDEEMTAEKDTQLVAAKEKIAELIG